ncbi:MAG: RNA methyltransferase [Candidatus Zixiibacteriota bacterium]
MLSKAILKELSRIKTKKGRDLQGRFLIEGLRLCEEAADSSWPIESVLFTASFEQKPRGKDLLRKLQELNAKMVQVKTQDIEKLSDTVTAQGIVCVLKRKSHPVEDLWTGDLRLVVALDGIRDPGNVGTLIRAADAFGADAIVLSYDTVELYSPKLVRSTMGSIFHLPIYDDLNLEKTISELKKREFRILGTDAKKGRDLGATDTSGRICLLIGNEAEGLSKSLHDLSDEIVHIPLCGRAESLNVAVAGGILLYEIARKRTCPPTL